MDAERSITLIAQHLDGTGLGGHDDVDRSVAVEQIPITVGRGGSVRVEYEYELLGPDTAGLQGLWGLGRPWIHRATYMAFVGF